MRDDVKVANYFEDKVEKWKGKTNAQTLESFLSSIKDGILHVDFDKDPKFEVVRSFFDNNSREQLMDIQNSEFVTLVEKEEKPNVKTEVLVDTMNTLEITISKLLVADEAVDIRKKQLIWWISAIALFVLVHSFSSSDRPKFPKSKKGSKLKGQYGTQ